MILDESIEVISLCAPQGDWFALIQSNGNQEWLRVICWAVFRKDGQQRIEAVVAVSVPNTGLILCGPTTYQDFVRYGAAR
jgi:hypothetical protein